MSRWHTRLRERGISCAWLSLDEDDNDPARFLVLRVLAKKEDADWAGALADVRRALTIAAPRNYVRVFLDEGHELGALIDRLDMGLHPVTSVFGSEPSGLIEKTRLPLKSRTSRRPLEDPESGISSA